MAAVSKKMPGLRPVSLNSARGNATPRATPRPLAKGAVKAKPVKAAGTKKKKGSAKVAKMMGALADKKLDPAAALAMLAEPDTPINPAFLKSHYPATAHRAPLDAVMEDDDDGEMPTGADDENSEANLSPGAQHELARRREEAKQRERGSPVPKMQTEKLMDAPPPPPAAATEHNTHAARAAMLADSLSARMAARRRERQQERRNSNGGAGGRLAMTARADVGAPAGSTHPAAEGTATPAGGGGGGGADGAALPGGKVAAAAVAAEMSKLKAERETRLNKLFTQLDRMSATQTAEGAEQAKRHREAAAQLAASAASASASAATAASSSHALVAFQPGASSAAAGARGSAIVPYGGNMLAPVDIGTGMVHGFQAQALLKMLRSKHSRRYLREWLSQDGRVEKVRELVANAPEAMQQVLVGVLSRLLAEDDDDEEVRITLVGGSAMLANKSDVGEERPLPRPMLLTHQPEGALMVHGAEIVDLSQLSRSSAGAAGASIVEEVPACGCVEVEAAEAAYGPGSCEAWEAQPDGSFAPIV